MEKILSDILEEYLLKLQKQSEIDKESNEIYGEIISVLTKEPNINLYELIATIRRNGKDYEKNKIRNRRDRVTAIHKSLDEAKKIVEKLLSINSKSLDEIEKILEVANIYRDRMVISLLLEEYFLEEFYEVYYSIKNEQCKGFIKEIAKELRKKIKN